MGKYLVQGRVDKYFLNFNLDRVAEDSFWLRGMNQSQYKDNLYRIMDRLKDEKPTYGYEKVYLSPDYEDLGHIDLPYDINTSMSKLFYDGSDYEISDIVAGKDEIIIRLDYFIREEIYNGEDCRITNEENRTYSIKYIEGLLSELDSKEIAMDTLFSKY